MHRVLHLGAAAAALLIVGCGGQQAPGPAPDQPAGPRVNRLVMAVEAPTQETNAKRMLATPWGWQLGPMYEYLIGIDPTNGKAVPELATEWKVEPDGQSVRFKLKQGVQFHKGYGEFTAKDLSHPITSHRIDDGNSHGGVIRFWTDVVDRVEVVNDYEAIYHLKRPDSTFFDFIGQQIGSGEINSRANFEKDGDGDFQKGPTAGTGPYQYVERGQATHVRFERVPYKHWRVTPDFPEFEFRFVREASTRLAAFLAGEVHVTALPNDLMGQAGTTGKVIKGRVPALRIFVNNYCCQLNDPDKADSGYIDPTSPLIDVRVRRALSKAINRDELNKAFFAGKGEVMYNNPFHPVRMGWNPDWQSRFADQYGFDQARARQLLTEAGYGPGNPAKFQVLLVPTPGVSSAPDLGEALAQYWRAVGAQPELVSIDPPTVTAQSRAMKLTNQVDVQGTNSDLWVGVSVINSTIQRPASRGPHLLEADNVLREIRTTIDEKKREELWRKEGDLLFAGHKFIPLFWLPVEVVANPKIVDDYLFPGSISGNWTHIVNFKAVR